MPGSSAPSPFFGVQVVRGAFVMAWFGWGVGFYGPPVFLQAVLLRSAWPLPLVSAAVTLHFLAGVPVAAGLPRLHARFGVPAIIVAGALVTAAGVFGWAVAARPWQLFAAALLSGMGWVALGAIAVNAVVSPWFQRTRPGALAKAYNGASLGGVVFSPLWVALIAWLGFARAALGVGVVMVALMAWLARRVFAASPAALGQQPDGDTGAAAAHPAPGARHEPLPGARLWREPAFLRLAAGMAAGLFAQIGLLAHLFTLLVPVLGAQPASLVMGAATGCAILGRSVAARGLLRGVDRRRVAAAGYAVQALGSLLLGCAAGRTGWLLCGVALFGSGIGNATSLPPLIAQSDFAPQDVPRVVALVVAIAQACYAWAPALFGLLLAAAGAGPGIGADTASFFGAAALVQLVAAAAIVRSRRLPAQP